MEYSAEQLNYFRICYVAFNLVPDGLRKIFKQEWDFRYKTTLGEWKDTAKNGADFYNNESRKSLSKNARYLATIRNGNTAEWDCSCLFFAILFSDSIGTTLSAAIRKDVDVLRQVRNDIAHITEAQLTDAEFQNYVGRVLLSFNALTLPVKYVDEVKNQTSFPIEEVNKLKMQVDNLQDELKKTKSDLQVAQDTVQTKEEQVENLTSDLEVAQGTIQSKEEQVESLTSDLQVAEDTIQSKEEQVECLTQEISSKVESFCHLTFKPSHEIIRRSNDVTRILTKMQDLQDRSTGAVSTIYLSGNPGCGKTQIARQIGEEVFTMRSTDSNVLTFVATLNAENLETLADSYMSLAKRVGVTEYTLTSLTTSKIDSPKEKIQYLQRLILSKVKQFSKWLIIADNVVELSLVRSYLPQTASEEWGHGQVLITTQDSSVIPTIAPNTHHESLSAGMQPEDAIELLTRVAKISSPEQVETVAEVLEYQPIALAAAAFYVQTVVSHGSSNYNWTNYPEALVRGEREATEEPLADVNPAYSKSMTAAIEMAIKSASNSDEVLCQLFIFLSLCDSESLPVKASVNFVKARTTGQTEELIKAKILKASLITCLNSVDGVPDYIRVHNVVHVALKKISQANVEFTERVECMSVAIQVFHSIIESERNRLKEIGNVCAMLRRITTHCKALYEVLTNTFTTKDALVKALTPFLGPEKIVSWLRSTADVCCDLSNPSNAKLFSTSACDFVRFLSSTREDDSLKADTFAVHGRVLSMSCEYELSVSYYDESTKLYISIYGDENNKVATNYNDLGEVYQDLGQNNEAKKYYEKALNIRKNIYGDEHADVAECYNNLGVVYRRLGQYNEAKEYHEKDLNISKKIYGEEHAAVAISYNNLGLLYRELGQYNEAKEYHEKDLNISKKIYGEEHAAVATSFNNLGLIYNDLGQYNEAKENQEKALNIGKKIYGQEHPDVATTYNNLGVVYRNLRQYNEAKKYHEKALIIRKKIFGEQHPDVTKSYRHLQIVNSKLIQQNQSRKEAFFFLLTRLNYVCEKSEVGTHALSHASQS